MDPQLQRAFFIAFVLTYGPLATIGSITHGPYQALHPTDETSDASAPKCSCDCCEVEVLEDTAADTRYQCTKIEEASALSFSSMEGRCRTQTCTRSPDDYVLKSAVTSEIDVQRFCFYECEPKIIESPHRRALQRGDECQPLRNDEVSGVADQSGNGKSPMDTGESMMHFVARKKVNLKGSRAAAAALAATKAALKAPAAVYKGEWSVVADPAPEMGARATEEATAAAAAAKKAKEASAFATDVMEKSSASVPVAIKNVDLTLEQASTAHDAEEDTNTLLEEVRKAAHEAAFEEIEDNLKEVRKQAHAEVKKEAVKKAKKLKEKMLKEAPKAAAAAAKVYEEAGKRAAATAAEYAKRGDAVSAKSVNVQMEAQMLLGQSNTWITLGDNAKAEKLLQQSHQMMNEAVGLAATANGFYGQAQAIMKTMPDYMAEAAAAGYNAEVMLNPDAPPPPPPLV